MFCSSSSHKLFGLVGRKEVSRSLLKSHKTECMSVARVFGGYLSTGKCALGRETDHNNSYRLGQSICKIRQKNLHLNTSSPRIHRFSVVNLYCIPLFWRVSVPPFSLIIFVFLLQNNRGLSKRVVWEITHKHHACWKETIEKLHLVQIAHLNARVVHHQINHVPKL